uniref:Probable ATP-dependent transporter ycf16 n=1 Tax=Erythrolobus australicus TaxID=1077150 RepID=A0A7S1XHH1_9RHOD|mmetsp:Transcript_4398/g.12042  ORF Transcript_4398/g.12042 Transcript_4398/m.12042 type:complete len:332 (+) Transcript_4398:93-1088(+)
MSLGLARRERTGELQVMVGASFVPSNAPRLRCSRLRAARWSRSARRGDTRCAATRLRASVLERVFGSGDSGKRRPTVSPLTQESAVLEMRKICHETDQMLDSYLFENLDFVLFPREIVLIIGPNGAGKSTFLSLCTGGTAPDKGEIIVQGQLIRKKDQLQEYVGYVLQNPAQAFLCDTVLEELVLFRSTQPQEVRQVMSAVGLDSISLRADPQQLSGGQQRRLALASVLLREARPRVFVMDEPLVGIDWVARRGLINLLSVLKRSRSIVIVTHEPGELLPYADRVYQLARRHLIEVDAATLHRAIAHRASCGEYEEGYTGENRLRGRRGSV